MAEAERAKANRASRLRLALAASALILAPALAVATPTLVIDSKGATYVIGQGGVAPTPPRRPAARGGATGPVTLDLSVLDGLDQVRPEARQGPIRLKRPSRLLAGAENVRPKSGRALRRNADASQPIRLIPPRRVLAAAPPIILKPPKSMRRSGGGAQLARVDIPYPPPLPRVRPSDPPPAQVARASTPALPSARMPKIEVVATPDYPTAITPASLRRTDLPDYVETDPAPLPQTTADGRIDLSPVPPRTPPPADRAAAAPVLLGPLPTPVAPAGARVEPASAMRESSARPGFADVEVTDDLRRKFPIIFARKDPPPMAQPGWKSAAPPAADRAARKPDDLPDLASLAPPPIDDEPKRALPPSDVALGVDLQQGVTQPGSAVLAPPPPPARDLQGSAEAIVAALPEPPVETPEGPPRRSLAVPPGLARVTPPGDDAPPEPLTVLTPPAAQDVAAAPALTPPPAGALAAMDRLADAADAPTEPEQLALPLDPPPAPAPRPAPAEGALETEIAFASASRSLPADAAPALSQIVARLKADPALRVRLAGAASAGEAKEARDLALARALEVQRYLVRQGVLSEAIRVEPVTGRPAKDAVAVRLVEPA